LHLGVVDEDGYLEVGVSLFVDMCIFYFKSGF